MRKIKVLLLCCLAGWAVTSAVAEESLIGIGDTVEISVAGAPDLSKRSIVNEDGNISYPLLGTVSAAGMSTRQLRDTLIDLAVKGDLLKAPRIGVEVVLRQPIYVSGEVLKPGAQPYVSNLTVRSAVALAGGLDPTGIRGLQVLTNPADLEGQSETQAIELVKQQMRLRLLQAELANQTTVTFDAVRDLPVSAAIVSKLAELENQELKNRLDGAENDRSSLKRIIVQLQSQVDALADRRKAEEESVRQESDQIAKVKALADNGIVVQGRLLDEQRAMLLIKSRLYEGTAMAAQTSRLIEETSRKLQSLDETRRLAILKEMQDVYTGMAQTTSKLAALRRQMGSHHTVRPPNFVIYRRQNGSQTRLDVDEDTAVQPGDIVEVGFGATAVAVH